MGDWQSESEHRFLVRTLGRDKPKPRLPPLTPSLGCRGAHRDQSLDARPQRRVARERLPLRHRRRAGCLRQDGDEITCPTGSPVSRAHRANLAIPVVGNTRASCRVDGLPQTLACLAVHASE